MEMFGFMTQPLRFFAIMLLVLLSGCSNVPYYGGPHENQLELDEVVGHILGEQPVSPREMHRIVWSMAGDLNNAYKGVVLLNQNNLTLNKWDSNSNFYVVSDTIQYKEIVRVTKQTGWGAKAASVVLITAKNSYLIYVGKQDSAWGVSESQAEIFLSHLNTLIQSSKKN